MTVPTPNRYHSLASILIHNTDNELDQQINCTDLQMAYIWVKEFMLETGGEWSTLPDFPAFADVLDRKVSVSGVRFATNTVYSVHYQLSVFYGHIAL
jgi:hypothetical protein